MFAAESPRGTADFIFRERFVEEFVDAEFFNDCTGEVILINGVLRFREMEIFAPTTFHRTFQIIQQGSGVGQTSGIVYNFHVSHVFEIHFTPGANEVTEIDNAFLVSKGRATNAALQLEIHATRSATGEITVEFEKVRVVCRGA